MSSLKVLILTIFLSGLIQLSNGQQSKTLIRGCYLTNWAQYRQGVGKWQTTQNYVPGICTHIFYAFAYINSSFQLYPADSSDLGTSGGYAQLQQLKQKDSNLKILISVGGATFNSSLFVSAASSQSNLKRFAQNAWTYARQYGFDGLDLDWEYPTSAAQKTALTSLLQALKSASNGRYLVTAAVSAGISNAQQAYDLPNLRNAVDFLNVMTYDYHGSWNQQTGINSPLCSLDTLSVNASIQYYLSQGFPASKIVLGIPTYGRGWTLSTIQTNQGIGVQAQGPSTAQSITQTAGIAAYYELCQVASQITSTSWSQQAYSPYMQRSNQWFSYDDSTSVSWKAYYAYQNQLAGVFVWTLDFDDFGGSCSGQTKYPLLNSISRTLTGKTYT